MTVSVRLPATIYFHINTLKDVGNPVRVILDGSGVFPRGYLALAMTILSHEHELSMADLTVLAINPTEPDDYVGMTEYKDTGVWV